MQRNATAVWNGTGKEGSGNLSTQSGVLNKTQYSWKARFADGTGTNPEELIAAAHAGCFTMKLTFILGAKDITPVELTTVCSITLENGAITGAHLDVKGEVPGVDADTFTAAAEEAKKECIISKLLNTNITLSAELLG